MYASSKVNKKSLTLCFKFYQYTFKNNNNNHYPTDVNINRNVVYYNFKRRDKFKVFDIWHKIKARMCQIFIFCGTLS